MWVCVQRRQRARPKAAVLGPLVLGSIVSCNGYVRRVARLCPDHQITYTLALIATKDTEMGVLG